MSAQPAPQESLTVGDILVTFLPDGEAHFSTAAFPASTDAAWEAHRRWLDDDGRWVTTLGGFLIETGDRKIVVDLGFGRTSIEIPDFARADSGRLLDSLGQAGVKPEQVDTVVYTHLHADHTGWTSSGPDRRLTFAAATHLIGSSAEWDFWRDNPEAAFAPDAESVRGPLETRIETAADGQAIAPGVNLSATPGHTPGHQSVIVSSGSDRAIILGDVLHCPAQIAEPEWSVMFDVDAGLARRTRDALMAELEGSATIAACSHFPGTVFGRVLPAEGRRLWQVG